MARKLTLVAGSGALVPHAITAARRAGFEVQVLTVKPRPDLDWPLIKPLNLRNPLAIVWDLKAFGTTHLAMVGGVSISDTVRERIARFLGGKKPEARESSTGDASLSNLARVLKTMTGATLVGVHELAPDLLAGEGLLAGPEPATAQREAAAFALKLAREIGRLDIGQAVVVSGKRVIGVEDIAGTDALLARVAQYRRDGLAGDGTSPLVLAKAVKPQQPLFADLPAIGPETIAEASEAGIGTVAIEAGHTLLIEREQLFAAAEAAGVSVLGMTIADA